MRLSWHLVAKLLIFSSMWNNVDYENKALWTLFVLFTKLLLIWIFCSISSVYFLKKPHMYLEHKGKMKMTEFPLSGEPLTLPQNIQDCDITMQPYLFWCSFATMPLTFGSTEGFRSQWGYQSCPTNKYCCRLLTPERELAEEQRSWLNFTACQPAGLLYNLDVDTARV